MKLNFRQDEGLAITAPILLIFTPLFDGRISFFISASIIIILIVACLIKRTGKFKLNPDNSGNK